MASEDCPAEEKASRRRLQKHRSSHTRPPPRRPAKTGTNAILRRRSFASTASSHDSTNVSRRWARRAAALATAADAVGCADPTQASADATAGRSNRADCDFHSHCPRYCDRANAKWIATASPAGSRVRYETSARSANGSDFESSNENAIGTPAAAGEPDGSNCLSHEGCQCHGTSRPDYSCIRVKSEDKAAGAERDGQTMADRHVRV